MTADSNNAANSELPKRAWFRQRLILAPMVTGLILYSIIGSGRPEWLPLVDRVLTPLVDSLHIIGLGITKPFMDGPMPERFYTNLVGIAVWGIVAYNLASLRWFIVNRGSYGFAKGGVERLMAKKGWSRQRATLYGHLGMFLLWLPFSVFATMALPNGIHGWLVFHVKDFVTPTLTIVTFLFPGAYVVAGWTVVAIYVLHYLRQGIGPLFPHDKHS